MSTSNERQRTSTIEGISGEIMDPNAKGGPEGAGRRGTGHVAYGSQESPIRLGDITLPGYVLEGGHRVVIIEGVNSALGLPASEDAFRLVRLVMRLAERGIDTKDLTTRLENPTPFWSPDGTLLNYGYEPAVLLDLCDVVVEAHRLGLLHEQDAPVGSRCEMILRRLVPIGFVALLDEATGYEKVRPDHALAQLLVSANGRQSYSRVRKPPRGLFGSLLRR